MTLSKGVRHHLSKVAAGGLVVVLAGAAGAYEPPSVPGPPPGVLIDLRVVPATEIPESEVPLVEDGIELTTTSCEQQAPLVWRVSGTATVPAGYKPTEISMLLSRPDETGGNAALDRYLFATLLGAGPFSIDVDVEPYLASPEREHILLTLGDVGEQFVQCGLWPITDLGFRHRPSLRDGGAEFRTEPLYWRAPRGSIQRLGRGVVLADRTDPRRGWAYLAWQDLRLPVRRVFTAPPAVLPVTSLSASYHEANPCLSMSWGGDRGSIAQRRRCGTDDLRLGEESTVPGWYTARWVDGGRPILVQLRGQTQLIIDARTPGRRAAIARAVRPYRNVRVGQQILGPEVGAPLATVIDLTLGTQLDLRSRFRDGRSQWVIATGLADANVDETQPAEGVPAVIAYRFTRPAGTWLAQPIGRFVANTRDGSHEPCVALVTTERWSLAVAALADGRIQQKLDDATVVDLPSVDGVHRSQEGLDPAASYRALDPAGNPLRCGQGEWLDDGEQWSSWTPPTARWRLPSEASPAPPLPLGTPVEVTARGFHPSVAVDVVLCPGGEVTWFRPDGCTELADTSANRRGRVAFDLVLPTEGLPFDCSAGCHVRLESRYGTTRATSIEVSSDARGAQQSTPRSGAQQSTPRS